MLGTGGQHHARSDWTTLPPRHQVHWECLDRLGKYCFPTKNVETLQIRINAFDVGDVTIYMHEWDWKRKKYFIASSFQTTQVLVTIDSSHLMKDWVNVGHVYLLVNGVIDGLGEVWDEIPEG